MRCSDGRPVHPGLHYGDPCGAKIEEQHSLVRFYLAPDIFIDHCLICKSVELRIVINQLTRKILLYKSLLIMMSESLRDLILRDYRVKLTEEL